MVGARAVPPELTLATIAGVNTFLTGAAAIAAPAVIARGVVRTMVTTKHWLAASCVMILGLGCIWTATAQVASDTRLPPVAAATQTSTAQPDPRAIKLAEPPVVTHRSTNFVVHAPTPVIARVVAGEAEFQRRKLAMLWLGKPLSDWDQPATILVGLGWTSTAGSTTSTFQEGRGGPRVTRIEVKLDGFTLSTLESSLPREITHAVLATHFGKPVPRWADEGIARLQELDTEQAVHDRLIRQLLREGRGVRLLTLLRMTEYPRDPTHLNAQGHSVCRFLLAAGHSRAAVLEFVRKGMNADAEDGWDRAARILGFKSVDRLESAWLAWLKTPESKLPEEPAPAAPKQDKLDRIPPVKLPGSPR
jgi:hypothetical protein